MTINALYNLWKEEKRGGLKPASLSTYTVLVERYILPAVGEQETVTPEDVQRIVESMGEKSAKTRQLTLNVLSNLLRYGGLPVVNIRLSNKLGPTPGNTGRAQPEEGPGAPGNTGRGRPEEELAIPGAGQGDNDKIGAGQGDNDKIDAGQENNDRTGTGEIRPLPAHAVRKLLTAFRQHPTPRNVGLYLALTTGIRASELCALRWQDVDDALHIRGSVSYLWDTEQHAWRAKEEGEQALVPRDIPLTQAQKRFLQQHRGAATTYILTGEGTPMQPHSLRAGTLRFLKQMGLQEYSLADFRHGFVVRCLQSGCNYTTLGALLGVQSIQRLQKKYGRFALTTPQTAMEKQMAAL